MKLPNDYFRCQGNKCGIKQTCARFKAIESDKGPVSMVNNMLDYMGNCNFHIPTTKPVCEGCDD